MREKRNAIVAWLFVVVIAFSNAGAILYFYSNRLEGEALPIAIFIFPFVPTLFALVGALIISYKPRNRIGLVMFLPGMSLAFITDAFLNPYLTAQIPPPAEPGALFLLILWYSNWSWLLLVLPIMFIMILFPTGRPLTPRWNWLVYFGVFLIVLFALLITFAEVLGPGSDPSIFQVANPIGFLKEEWIDTVVTPFVMLFPFWIIACATSLFVRFRRAKVVERQQIKWLFYAAGIFVLCYLPPFFFGNWGKLENIWNMLLPIGMATFPIAIAIAILRYRLYDIDVIIRRTLQYAIVTGILALTYFGVIVILQGILGPLTGSANSPVVTVITTLGIAGLFNPLRNRVQDFIDRRFYRAKYDAEKTLANFADMARDEVDMEKLSAALLNVAEETMQPEQVSLWIQ